ncbi:NADH-quinone oxidoreductase subunit C [Nigerium massiliense]|uniref:NADH-quinone oxidoreductase subunit C n=1 Tax=Nigerium massiliense TaxID=1522317 RepID=UPI0006948C5A|nr:NADH-quinone oxidoreductase subunit C [Nigerium massiliense]
MPADRFPADEVRRVEPSSWLAVVRAAASGRAFDWLGAADEIGRSNHLRVVCRLRATGGDALRLETLIDRDDPRLDSIAEVYPGASWHEREARDFFGIAFTGGDNRPLLLRDGFGGRPLRKDFVLGARVIKAWPGGKEPGDAKAAGRRRMVPPGVPDPEVWGDREGAPASADEVAASVVGGRVRRRR